MERFTQSKVCPPSARYPKLVLCHPYKGAPLGLARRESCRRHTLAAFAIVNTCPPTFHYPYRAWPPPPPAPTAAPAAAAAAPAAAAAAPAAAAAAPAAAPAAPAAAATAPATA